MNSPKIEERFSRDLDDLLQTGSLPDGEAVPEQYLEMLQLADRLSKIDPSQSSNVRLPLRARLVERAERELPARSARRAWGGRLALAGKWTLSVAALAALILGLIWVFSNLVPSPRHQPAAAGTSAPAGTPASASTLAPIPAELPLPTPPPLSLDTPLEEIIERMSSPLWNTLWLSGVALTEELAGQPQRSLVQAWIDRDGRGRVLSSDPLLGEVIDPAAAVPRYAWISDGSRYALYDLQTGQPGPTSGLYGWAGHALENAGPFMELVFPYYIPGRGGFFQAVGQDTLAGRPVLVVEWRPDETSPLQDRFWVDTETGQILRRQTLLQDEVTVVKDLRVDSLVYNADFPQNLAGAADVLSPESLASIRFAKSPEDVFVPSEYLQLPEPVQLPPSPVPQVEVGSSTLALLQMEEPVYTGELGSGDLYLARRIYGDETDGLIRLDDQCFLSGSAACPFSELDYPSLAGSPLYWSPDGLKAAHLDTNNSRLLLFEPQTSTWRTLLEPFLPSVQVLSWSPDGVWIAASTQTVDSDVPIRNYGSQSPSATVTLVRSDGSAKQFAAPDLGGMQVPLGWLAGDRLLMMQWEDVQKGQVGQASTPVLYDVNLTTGGWSPLPLELDREAVAMLPVLSPDGTRLIVPIDGGSALAVYSIATGELTPLSASGMNPTWSPDGQWLALVQVIDGIYQVNLVRADGSETRMVFEWAAFPVVTWSKDGLTLAIEASPAEDQPSASLFLYSIQDGSLRLVQLEGETGSRMSTSADEYIRYELRYPSFRP